MSLSAPIYDYESSTTIYRNKSGQYHCDTGPAVIRRYGKTKEYYQNGLRHRLDGPAIEDNDMPTNCQYYIYGKLIDKEWITKNNITFPLSESDLIFLKLSLL